MSVTHTHTHTHIHTYTHTHTDTHTDTDAHLEFGLQASAAGPGGGGVEFGQVGLQRGDLQLGVSVQVVLQQGLEDEHVLHLCGGREQERLHDIMRLH